MNKTMNLLLLATLLSGGYTTATAATKQERIKALLDLTVDRKNITPMFAPLLAQKQWQDEQTKAATLDKIVDCFYQELEQKYIVLYDRLFNESEIEELIAFNSSPVGKKLTGSIAIVASEMGNVGIQFAAKAQQIIADAQTNLPTV